MKKGKEIELYIRDNYNVTMGTVDRKDPKSLFITISAWISPTVDDETTNYNNLIITMKRLIKLSILDNHFDFNNELTIVDLDIRESGIKFGKRSFMSCEVTLFQNNTLHNIFSETMIENIKIMSANIIADAFDTSSNFLFYRKKT